MKAAFVNQTVMRDEMMPRKVLPNPPGLLPRRSRKMARNW